MASCRTNALFNDVQQTWTAQANGQIRVGANGNCLAIVGDTSQRDVAPRSNVTTSSTLIGKDAKRAVDGNGVSARYF